eukprot:m.193094 g.193094  ORF g.193094 m.193094 type:complete len:960 (-) comp18283_c0_seq1:129-3008(-)
MKSGGDGWPQHSMHDDAGEIIAANGSVALAVAGFGTVLALVVLAVFVVLRRSRGRHSSHRVYSPHLNNQGHAHSAARVDGWGADNPFSVVVDTACLVADEKEYFRTLAQQDARTSGDGQHRSTPCAPGRRSPVRRQRHSAEASERVIGLTGGRFGLGQELGQGLGRGLGLGLGTATGKTQWPDVQGTWPGGDCGSDASASDGSVSGAGCGDISEGASDCSDDVGSEGECSDGSVTSTSSDDSSSTATHAAASSSYIPKPDSSTRLWPERATVHRRMQQLEPICIPASELHLVVPDGTNLLRWWGSQRQCRHCARIRAGSWHAGIGSIFPVSVAVSRNHKPSTSGSKAVLGAVLSEARLLLRFAHPNIVRCIGVSQLDVAAGVHGLITEFADAGTLDELLDDVFGTARRSQDKSAAADAGASLDADRPGGSCEGRGGDNNSRRPLHLAFRTGAVRLAWAQQLAAGLSHMHRRQFVHGSLSPATVLIFTRQGSPVVKLGLPASRICTSTDTCESTGHRNLGRSATWRAPELLAGTGKATSQSDVYSLALLLYTLSFQKRPFDDYGLTATQTMYLVATQALQPSLPEQSTARWNGLLSTSWSTDVSRRASMARIVFELQHTEFDFESVVSGGPRPGPCNAQPQTPEANDPRTAFFELAQPRCVDADAITVSDIVGCGGNAYVYRATWRRGIKLGRFPVAVKVLMKADAQKHRESFAKEAKLLSRLNHPSIVQFFGVTLVNRRPALVTELAHKGSLRSLLHDSDTVYGAADIQLWLSAIATGLAYLEGLGVCHLDLKADNVLLFEQEPGTPRADPRVSATTLGFQAKICDLGLARYIGDKSASATDEGTVRYMAPEMITPGSRVSSKTDVYSFAVVALEVVCRRVPFEGLSLGATVLAVARGLRPDIPATMAPQLRDLIADCWLQERDARPSFAWVVDFLKRLPISAFEPVKTAQALPLGYHA